jgi:subtilisin family serine protease
VTVFPRIVAPGVNIFTTGLVQNNAASYVSATGTSLSAPHVTGAVALLLSAFPNLTIDQEISVLTTSAKPIGSPTPDNDAGSGGLDVYAAYQAMLKLTGIPVPPSSSAVHVYFPVVGQ